MAKKLAKTEPKAPKAPARAKKAKTVEVVAPTLREGTYTVITIESIKLNPDNPRQFERDDDYTALMADIQKVGGIHTPIGIRIVEGEGGEAVPMLIYGERRTRAMQELGFVAIPAIIHEVSEEEAYAMTVSENLSRQDLKPLEEARAIQNFIERGWTYNEIASQFGRSTKWIARRASLLDLSDKWKEHLENNQASDNPWPIETYRRIGLLHAEDQQRFYEERWDETECSADDVESWAKVGDSSYKDPRFNMVVEKDGKKVCDNCGEEVGFNEFLFDELNPDNDYCTNQACFRERVFKVAGQMLEEWKENYPDIQPVRYHNTTPADAVAGWTAPYDGNLRKWFPKEEGEMPPDGYKPFMYIDGNPRVFGTILWAQTPAQQTATDSPSDNTPTEDNSDDMASIDKKILQKRKLRARAVSEKMVSYFDSLIARLDSDGLVAMDDLAAFYYGLEDSIIRSHELLVFRLIETFGTNTSEPNEGRRAWEKWHTLDNKVPNLVKLYKEALQVVRRRLSYNDIPHFYEMAEIAAAFHIRINDMWEKECKAQPDAKSWTDAVYKRLRNHFHYSELVFPFLEIMPEPVKESKLRIIKTAGTGSEDVSPEVEAAEMGLPDIHPDLIPEEHELDSDGELLPEYVEKYNRREHNITMGLDPLEGEETEYVDIEDEIDEDEDF